MTVDEKRHQKAMLLLETEEAKSELAHLLEKAHRMGDAYLELGKALRTVYGANDTGNAERSVIGLCESEVQQDGVSAVVELANEIIAARSKVNELNVRRTALGL